MSPDLLKNLVVSVRAAIEVPARMLVPPQGHSALGYLLDLGGLLGVAALVAAIGIMHQRLPARGAAALRAICGLVAILLVGWLVRHPGVSFDELCRRWDHLALAGLSGIALQSAPPFVRKLGLTVLSLVVVRLYTSWAAVLGVGGACVLGTLLLYGPLRDRPGLLAAAQAALLLAAYVWALEIRAVQGPYAGLRVQGLLAFAGLRQISFLVEARRARRPLIDYALYLTFYPGAFGLFGGPEVFAEFSRRNLVRAAAPDHRRALRRIARGAVQMWIALSIPLSVDQVLTAGGPLTAWPVAIALFLRTAVGLMGAWDLIDGTALFYGVQLRANFRGLVGCQNPSELWWAWRGCLTNWLVQHVYAPLGARRHATRNITAAFAVSFLWHAAGVPFLSADFALLQLLPVALWAAVNGAGVLLHVDLPPMPDWGWPGRLLRTVAMWALGALTPILLHFQGPAFARFPEVFPVLLGIGR